jgi:serine protease
MKHRGPGPTSRGAGLGAIVIAGCALAAALPLAQEAAVVGTRQVVADLTAPGIDRGLRENDLPRAVRTSAGSGIEAAIDRGGAFRTDSILVKFRPGTTVGTQRALLALVDGSAMAPLSYSSFDVVALAGQTNPEAAAARLAEQPDVEYAQARYRIRPSFVPNDPFYARQWNYAAIDMERAWDINPGASASITVAVLDTGVAHRNALVRYFAPPWSVSGIVFPALGAIDVPVSTAPELGGPDRFVAPRDFIWNDVAPDDLDGHGTHVAGTIGQLTNNGVGVAGMAFNVRIMPVKVLDTTWDFVFGSPFFATDDVVARGIRYAVDNGAKVLNLSLGRTGAPAPVLRDAIVYAVSRGAFVAVAAGNDFLRGNPIERPADVGPDIEGAVAVGAVGRANQRAAYSSTGTFIELMAPGGDQSRDGLTGGILQQSFDFDFTDTYIFGPARYRAPRFDAFAYQYLQGTSMAAPHVAGFAALLMQQGVTNPAAIEAIMKQFATDLGTPGRDNAFGYGLINPRAALRGMGLAR